MATTTIGTAARTYATWSAWATYFNALALNTGGPETANPYNDSEFAVAGAVCLISNTTTTSSNFLTIIPGSGQSFTNNANVRTNALYYNAANGVGIKDTATGGSSICFKISDAPFSVINGLQFTTSDGGILFNTNNSSNTTVSNCIFVGTEIYIGGGSSTGVIFNNCVFVNIHGPNNRGIVAADTAGATVTFNFCTFITSPALAFYVYNAATANYTNCAFFGGGTTGFNATTPTADTFNHCMTDIAGTTGLTGGKVFASQFVSTTNDFRAKAGADLINAGTPVSGITTDISGFTRNASTPTIGAWEVAGAAPAARRPLPLLGVGGMIGWRATLGAAAAWRLGAALRDNAILSRRTLLRGRKGG